MDSWLEQYEQIVDSLYAQITAEVHDAMIAAGEDPENKELLCTRRLQVAYGLNSQAQRDDARRRDEWMLADRTGTGPACGLATGDVTRDTKDCAAVTRAEGDSGGLSGITWA